MGDFGGKGLNAQYCRGVHEKHSLAASLTLNKIRIRGLLNEFFYREKNVHAAAGS
jgi:hypothetical protein